MFGKYLNKASFTAEKNRYIKKNTPYSSYANLMVDERWVDQVGPHKLKGKSFASTQEDKLLEKLLDRF